MRASHSSFIGDVVAPNALTAGAAHACVWSRPGFLTITPESMVAEKSIILDIAAQANVTVSALDARGLYTTEIDASERGARSQMELANGMAVEYYSDSAERAGNVLGELADGTGAAPISTTAMTCKADYSN